MSNTRERAATIGTTCFGSTVQISALYHITSYVQTVLCFELVTAQRDRAVPLTKTWVGTLIIHFHHLSHMAIPPDGQRFSVEERHLMASCGPIPESSAHLYYPTVRATDGHAGVLLPHSKSYGRPCWSSITHGMASLAWRAPDGCLLALRAN